MLWPHSASELFICNTYLYYHYCSDFSLDGPGFGSLFTSWSTVSGFAETVSEWWEQWGVHGHHPQ